MSVLVLSCDKYSDLWRPYFTLFWRYWPDCKFPVFLGTNHQIYKDNRVETIAIGPDVDWSSNLITILRSIESPFVIISLEDFFLRKNVREDLIDKSVNAMIHLDATMITLQTRSKPTKFVRDHSFLREYKRGAQYRVSCQAALWDREKLIELLVPGETAWEFEVNASERSRYLDEGFYGLTQTAFPYFHHVVEKGKWFPWAAKEFGAMQIGCDFSVRPIMNASEVRRWQINLVLSFFKKLFPYCLRLEIKRIIGRS